METTIKTTHKPLRFHSNSQVSDSTPSTLRLVRASTAINCIMFVFCSLVSPDRICALPSPRQATGLQNVAGQAARKESSVPDLIARVRDSVVKIVVVRMDLKETRLPASVTCPFTHSSCVVGSGFFVNDTADVVTASHVVDEVTKVVQQLTELQIPAIPVVSMEVRNSDNARSAFIGNQSVFPFRVRGRDPVHDLAVLSPTENLTLHSPAATLDVWRSRDGTEIFACGYPLGALELTTTFGRVATTWAMYKLSTADYESEVLRLDLKANIGNSGGPIFDMANQNVIGLAVEQSGDANTPIIIAVPAYYVATLLKRENIKMALSRNH
jgi:S1-C subfamily serine protease